MYKEVLEWRLIRVAFLLLVAFAAAFGLVQTTTLNIDAPVTHVLLWVGCALLCWPLWHAVLAGVLYLMRLRPPLEIALAAVLATVFATLPCTAIVYSVSGWVRGQYPGALAVYAEVATLAFLLSGLLHYIACQRVKERYAHLAMAPAATAGEAAGRASATAASGFFDRLPPMLGEDIVYLGVSGHYLNVVTTVGLPSGADAPVRCGGRAGRSRDAGTPVLLGGVSSPRGHGAPGRAHVGLRDRRRGSSREQEATRPPCARRSRWDNPPGRRRRKGLRECYRRRSWLDLVLRSSGLER